MKTVKLYEMNEEVMVIAQIVGIVVEDGEIKIVGKVDVYSP